VLIIQFLTELIVNSLIFNRRKINSSTPKSLT